MWRWDAHSDSESDPEPANARSHCAPVRAGAPLPPWRGDSDTDGGEPQEPVSTSCPLPRHEEPKLLQRYDAGDSSADESEKSDSAVSLVSSEGGVGEAATPVVAALSMENAMAVLGSGDTDVASCFSDNGVSKERISNVFQTGGGCRCSTNCPQKFTQSRILAIAKLFWQIPKQFQDALLWSLSTPPSRRRHYVDDGKRQRISWSLEGVL